VKKYQIRGTVELFPQKGGWYFIRIPLSVTEKMLYRADRGLIPVNAEVGQTSWNTSLMPMGDGTHFIALNEKVRKKENIKTGKTIDISFCFR